MKALQKLSPQRRFLKNDVDTNDWESLKPYFDILKNREVSSVVELEKWLRDYSELDSVLSEDLARRYILMTTDTTNTEFSNSYQHFVSQIFPNAAPESNFLNQKLIESPIKEKLDQFKYFTMLRSASTAIELFREENVSIEAELKNLESRYGNIAGQMTVEHDGEILTMQAASQILKQTDRKLRKKIYFSIQGRRLEDRKKLDELLSKMVALRHQIAVNAGFENYRDYKFKELGRYDYSPKDCYDFHKAVEEQVLPIIDELLFERKTNLGLEQLRPWDLSVDPSGGEALKPFRNVSELLSKSQEVFEHLDPQFSDCLKKMEKLGHFDLDSRLGKAPGGYNYPLEETGLPFIFMNATSSLGDLITMMHEGGHAIHSFLTKDLELSAFRHTPAEVAEVASMSMELISMEHWNLFFNNEEDLVRAKKEQFRRSISVLPWIAQVDEFQHWLYLNPKHTVAERHQQWLEINDKYKSKMVDRTETEHFAQLPWQSQLHIFEVPFYYIEYGISQLASIAIWKKYKENKTEGLSFYRKFLEMGYTRPIPEIYKAGGIEFNFSSEYVAELMGFLKSEMDKLG